MRNSGMALSYPAALPASLLPEVLLPAEEADVFTASVFFISSKLSL